MKNLSLLNAEEILAAYAEQVLTPLEILHAITKHINHHNPEINAFVVMNPNAIQAAEESAKRWSAGKPLSVLDGVPVTVKDLIDIAGLPTRRGSKTTDSAPVPNDAPLVSSLRAAGAVILGKTTTTEYGWKSPGDCPANGITRNPWNPLYTAGGSSSGAAAAAAAGFGPLHVGTDAGGSIRIPAAWSGVVGLKPSFGRVPQWPIGAFGHIAVAGPIARNVRDVALLLSVIAEFNSYDPFSLPDIKQDFREGIEAGVAGMRIGVLQNPGFNAPVTEDCLKALVTTQEILLMQGAQVTQVDIALPNACDVFSKIWGAALARVVNSLPEGKRNLLDPDLRNVASRFENTLALDLLQAEALRLQAAHEMARAMKEGQYDALICPTVPQAAPLADALISDPVAALWQNWAPWTFLFNLTRQPAISLPMGFNNAKLPIAVQIAAPIYRDDIVLRVARTIERARSSVTS